MNGLKSKEIFIISLKNFSKFSKQRTENLVSKLQNLDFNINKINFVGINGAFLKHKKINSKYISLDKFSFNKYLGTLGCALSHILVLKLAQIKKINDDFIILEEDANIYNDFNFLYKHLPKNYDIIYLHSNNESLFYEQGDDYDVNFFFKRIVRGFPENTDPGGLTGLIVNGRNINKILNIILPVKEAIDWHYMNFYHELNLYYVKPELNIILNSEKPKSLRYTLDIMYDKI